METGKRLEEIKKAKGIKRNVLMDLLYRAGGRKRLRDILGKDGKLMQIVSRIEEKLSQ